MSGFGRSNTVSSPQVFDVPEAPQDTVSDIVVKGNRIAASSWAKDIRVWELQSPSSAAPRAMYSYPTPILSCSFNNDATKVFTGDCDNAVRLWDCASNSVQQIGQHTAPVKEVHWVDALNVLISAGWDKNMHWWDPRAGGTPQKTFPLPDRAYCMDVNGNMLAVGCADLHVVAYDLSNPQSPWTGKSSLKLETRSISMFPDRTGFGLTSSEGRCSIQYFNPGDQHKNFSFKCHRDKDPKGLIHCVHSVRFHPTLGTFATAGGDGMYHFWDKEARSRLSSGTKRLMPITAANFNPEGTLYVFATGYDWSKGVDEYEKNVKTNLNKRPKLHVHVLKEEEVKPKGK